VNSITVTGYGYQWAQQADLELFLQTYRPDMPSNITFALQEVDGGLDEQYPDEAGGEADMDIELTVGLTLHAAFACSSSRCLQVGLSNGIPVTFLSVGADWNDQPGSLGQDGLLDTISFIASQKKKPTVVSTSYGQDEY
jgi:tripeptidyl-peptidase-1